TLDKSQQELIAEIWNDLQYAYKFGSLIRLDEKVKSSLHRLVEQRDKEQGSLFSDKELGVKPKPIQANLFTEHDIEKEKQFAATFFANLKTAVEQYAQAQGNTFLTSKTRDAITFLELLTTEYDVATANPPYTDSGDFGPELREFIDDNYKKPYKFHTNLYASFIKRCYDFTGKAGFVAMLHPLTFMYIKTFEDVRKFMLTKTNLNLLAELGLGGVFANSDVQVDAAMYVLEKKETEADGTYFDLKKYKNHTNKPDIFREIYDNCVSGIYDEHVFIIPQSKLKIIESWPFIYWISDDFREKFGSSALEKNADIVSGVKTGNNNGAVRHWWEIDPQDIFDGTNEVRWVMYTKGGPFRKWSGNNWLCVNYANNASYIRGQNSFNLVDDKYWKNIGLSYSGSGSKGISFRFKPEGYLFDMGASAVFPKVDVYYALSALNSKLVFYITDCLNPTVNKQPNDVKRIPLPKQHTDNYVILSKLSKRNVEIYNAIDVYSIIEKGYKHSPFLHENGSGELKGRLRDYFSYENHLLTQVLVNEAIINEKIFEVYDLTEDDRVMVLATEGKSIGALPVSPEARAAYLGEVDATKEFPLDAIRNYIESLPTGEFTAEEREAIEGGFITLYQGNNTLEEFCIR
ncbi:MAG TPA: hypothetical protein PKZ15_11655, partial [Paludibacteraceae bacterium]|nr:hypothetical protein [Paludibacteraceae bacterium]